MSEISVGAAKHTIGGSRQTRTPLRQGRAVGHGSNLEELPPTVMREGVGGDPARRSPMIDDYVDRRSLASWTPPEFVGSRNRAGDNEACCPTRTKCVPPRGVRTAQCSPHARNHLGVRSVSMRFFESGGCRLSNLSLKPTHSRSWSA